MPESIIDSERDEARAERFRGETDPHPLDCTCSRACRLETSGMTEAEARRRR